MSSLMSSTVRCFSSRLTPDAPQLQRFSRLNPFAALRPGTLVCSSEPLPNLSCQASEGALDALGGQSDLRKRCNGICGQPDAVVEPKYLSIALRIWAHGNGAQARINLFHEYGAFQVFRGG